MGVKGISVSGYIGIQDRYRRDGRALDGEHLPGSPFLRKAEPRFFGSAGRQVWGQEPGIG